MVPFRLLMFLGGALAQGLAFLPAEPLGWVESISPIPGGPALAREISPHDEGPLGVSRNRPDSGGISVRLGLREAPLPFPIDLGGLPSLLYPLVPPGGGVSGASAVLQGRIVPDPPLFLWSFWTPGVSPHVPIRVRGGRGQSSGPW